MKTFNSITLQNGKVLKLNGGQKHRNNNTIRYFCEHVYFFYKHQNIIFGNSRMFLTPIFQNGGDIYTLGGLLEWWKCMPLMATIKNEGVTRYILAVSSSCPKSFITVTMEGEVKEVTNLTDSADRVHSLDEYCRRYCEAARDYEHLSLKNVYDTIVSWNKQMEKQMKIEKIWSPYRDNIELIYEHREGILAHRDWAMAAIPLKVYTVCQPIRIGTMLRLWANENKWLTYPCKCGHKAFIYSFAGSPLSGTTSISYKCVHCHEKGNAQVDGFLTRAHTLAVTQQELSNEAEGIEAITLTELLENIKRTNLK